MMCVLMFPFLLRLTTSYHHSHAKSNCDPEVEDVDIRSTMLGAMNQIPSTCVAVVFYDELISELTMDNLMQQIHAHQQRVALTLDLSFEQVDRFRTTDPAEIIQIYIARLYRQSTCYAFLVWLKDPSVIYPDSTTIHPGWRKQDFVIIGVHQHSILSYKQIIDLRIWKEIPNIVAIKKNEFRATRIPIFTVNPNYRNGQRKPEVLDTWIVKQNQFQKNATLFKEKFKNFNDGDLMIGALWKLPFLIWGDRANPYLDGLDWRLTQMAKNELNYVMKFHKHFTSDTGYLVNGTWTGIMGLLANGEIDIAIGGLPITPRKLEYFDFCRTYLTDSYTFISPVRVSAPSIWNAVTRPLGPYVWVATGISAFLATCCMKFLAVAEQKLRPNGTHYKDQYFTRMRVNIFIFFSAFCQKPTFYVPKSIALRFAYAGISFSLISLGIVFGARLFSIILIRGPNISIDELAELDESRLPIHMRDYDTFLSYYMRTTYSSLYNRTSFMNQTCMFDTIDEVVKGNLAYIDARSSLDFIGTYWYRGSGGFKFHLSTEDILRVNIGWAVRKNWPYREAIDRIIMATVESGVTNHWMNHFRRGSFGWDNEAYKMDKNSPYLLDRENRTADFDPSADSERNFKLTLHHFVGVGFVWIIGMSIACGAFFIELILNWTMLIKSAKKADCEDDDLKKQLEADKDLQKQLNRLIKKDPKLYVMWADFADAKALHRRSNVFLKK